MRLRRPDFLPVWASESAEVMVENACTVPLPGRLQALQQLHGGLLPNIQAAP